MKLLEPCISHGSNNKWNSSLWQKEIEFYSRKVKRLTPLQVYVNVSTLCIWNYSSSVYQPPEGTLMHQSSLRENWFIILKQSYFLTKGFYSLGQ